MQQRALAPPCGPPRAAPAFTHCSRRCTVAPLPAAKKGGSGAGGKGFGAAKPEGRQVLADGCPCGSNKHYKKCCKPVHTGEQAASSVEATVRARFSAIIKKDVSYLLASTHPDFHSFQYGTEPGGALRRLQDDLFNTVDHYDYSNLRIHSVQPGDKADEAVATFQYTVYDKRTPLIDESGKKARKVQIERSTFRKHGDTGGWLFAEYQLAEVPENLAKLAESQAKDMAAAAQQPQQ